MWSMMGIVSSIFNCFRTQVELYFMKDKNMFTFISSSLAAHTQTFFAPLPFSLCDWKKIW